MVLSTTQFQAKRRHWNGVSPSSLKMQWEFEAVRTFCSNKRNATFQSETIYKKRKNHLSFYKSFLKFTAVVYWLLHHKNNITKLHSLPVIYFHSSQDIKKNQKSGKIKKIHIFCHKTDWIIAAEIRWLLKTSNFSSNGMSGLVRNTREYGKVHITSEVQII